jgi:hypothetical protein
MTVKDIIWTMATKRIIIDLGIGHLAVSPLSPHIEGAFRMNIYAARGIMGQKELSAQGFIVFCDKFHSLLAKSSSLRGHVSFLPGAILHCQTVLCSSDLLILMFVLHIVTRKIQFLIWCFSLTR